MQVAFDRTRLSDILTCIDTFHVVKIDGAFDNPSLLSDLRDAIEITDFFLARFEGTQNEADKDLTNKDLALRRFRDLATSRKYPAFPLEDTPLAAMAVDRLLESSGVLQEVISAKIGREYARHSSWARPAQSSQADRRTEWYWHQDKPFHKGDDLTIWFPLVDCGVDAPAVEFFVNNATTILPVDPKTNWSIDPLAVESLPATHTRFTPAFSIGDCVVFDGLAIHRTHATAEMKKERTSIDVRIAARELEPDERPRRAFWPQFASNFFHRLSGHGRK
jgi:hypothetical protein